MELTTLLDRFPFGGAFRFDADLRYVEVGGGGFDLIDLDPSDLVGRTPREALPPESAGPLEDLLHRARDDGEASGQIPYVDRLYDCWAVRIGADEGRTGGVALFTWDVTDFARQASDLELIRAAMTQLDVGVTIADARADDVPLVFVNEGFLRLTGYDRSEVVGRNCRFLQGESTDPGPVATMRAAIDEGNPAEVTLRNYRKDGSGFWNRVSLHPVSLDGGRVTHFVGIQEDVTKERAMAEQAAQSQRLTALGQLAGGVAHDLRNVLMGVGGLLELTLEEESPSEAVEQHLREALDILAGGASVTSRLLAFAREEILNHRHIPLGQAVQDRVDFFERVARDDIAVVLDRCDGDLWMKGDSGHLDRILLNLVGNAEDALPPGGTVRFRVVGGEEALEPSPLPPELDPGGEWIRVTVEDDGPGMPPEVRERAMDPFFTTKEEGRGTGLGLPSVYGTVRQMEGHVLLRSEPGEGTTVHLFFPRVPPPDRSSEVRSATEKADAAPGLVLLVEDEDPVRKVCRRALERAGHLVREARSMDEAVALIEEEGGAADLLVTDAVIPGGSGLSLMETLRARRPGVPILLMSGYTGKEVDRSAFGGGVGFLAKPFPLERLVERADELIRESRARRRREGPD
jgi:PAS domain S-box-containing protein